MFKKKLAVLALGAAAMAGAQAATVMIDDFSTDQGPVYDLSVNNKANSSGVISLNGNVSRELIINATGFGGDPTEGARVKDLAIDPFNQLRVTHGVGDDSEVIVRYTLAAGLLPANATNPTFKLMVVASDANPTNVRVVFNNDQLLSQNIAGNTNNQLLGFTANAASFNLGGTLDLVLNGAAGWDFSLDQFSFTYGETNNNVPEPASLALVALGLVGIGAGRRKARKA